MATMMRSSESFDHFHWNWKSPTRPRTSQTPGGFYRDDLTEIDVVA